MAALTVQNAVKSLIGPLARRKVERSDPAAGPGLGGKPRSAGADELGRALPLGGSIGAVPQLNTN